MLKIFSCIMEAKPLPFEDHMSLHLQLFKLVLISWFIFSLHGHITVM